MCHYIVVRADLPRGIQAAQIAHAAGESSPGNLPSGTHAVILSVATAHDLEAVSARLTHARIAHVRIHESDPPFTGQIMALGCAPMRKGAFRRCLSSLPLLR